MNPSPFSLDLAAVLRAKIRQLRLDGITGIGADNLWQLTAPEISRLPSAPRGTCAAWIARQEFDARLEHPPFAAFILPPRT